MAVAPKSLESTCILGEIAVPDAELGKEEMDCELMETAGLLVHISSLCQTARAGKEALGDCSCDRQSRRVSKQEASDAWSVCKSRADDAQET